MMIRDPIVADKFYSGDEAQCRKDVQVCLRTAKEASSSAEADQEIGTIFGGLVPHAGWMCSGAVAARVFQAIASRHKPHTVVIFGAVHVLTGTRSAVFGSGAWETPLGLVKIDERLAERLHGQTGLLEMTPHAHEREHSIEVQLPFIQHLMPHAKIVPIMVPINDKAAAVGASVGQTCKGYGADVVIIGSTDLTHYGPSYNFTPKGVGKAGLDWAKNVNDRRLIDLILDMREEAIVEDAVTNRSACGGGAIAATIAACRALGAKQATLLEHTTSHEVLSQFRGDSPRDAVGYAGVVFH